VDMVVRDDDILVESGRASGGRMFVRAEHAGFGPTPR
jgi:hypothetical protein